LTNLIADHREDNPYRKALVRELVAYNDQHAPLENWQYVGFYVLGGRPRRSRPRRTRSYASRETMKGGSWSNLAAPSRLRERPETALARRWSVLRRRTAVHPFREFSARRPDDRFRSWSRDSGSARSFCQFCLFAVSERPWARGRGGWPWRQSQLRRPMSVSPPISRPGPTVFMRDGPVFPGCQGYTRGIHTTRKKDQETRGKPRLLGDCRRIPPSPFSAG